MHFTSFVLASLAGSALGKVQFLGVAIAGFDFGCDIDGSCPQNTVQPPLSSLGGSDGAGQMQHFVNDDQLNMFRLPVGWQYLVNDQLGGTLDSTNFGNFDQLVQACLETGAYCMLDIHNFARWNEGIIGQGGPTDEQFTDLWSQLATKYADDEKVVFGLMNEPHDLDVQIWAQTCQKAITAIRQAGAKTQMILLPGTNFDSAGTLVSSGSAAALMNLTNPDGSTDNLILDIHKYLDENNSGTHEECVFDNIDAFTDVANFLRENNRKGIVSETGASNDASCMTRFTAQNTFINENSDVYIGLVAWAAGSFSTSYILSLTPSNNNGQWTDTDIMTQCVLAPWNNSEETVSASTTASATAAASKSTSETATTLSTSTSATSQASASSTANDVVSKPSDNAADSKSIGRAAMALILGAVAGAIFV